MAGFHENLLKPESFSYLIEIDLSFNFIEFERSMWFLTQTKALDMVVISGNPIAVGSKRATNAKYENFERELLQKLDAVVINDTSLSLSDAAKKGGAGIRKDKQKQHFPYPNPIKLNFSKDNENKEIKGDYLNAEIMRQGIALPISDIRPSTNLESDIFPRQKTGQEGNLFTPPTDPGKAAEFGKGEESNFFITEDVRNDFLHQDDPIQEEKSEGSDEKKKTEPAEHWSPLQQEDQAEEDAEDFEVFDFGQAKMDFFK